MRVCVYVYIYVCNSNSDSAGGLLHVFALSHHQYHALLLVKMVEHAVKGTHVSAHLDTLATGALNKVS